MKKISTKPLILIFLFFIIPIGTVFGEDDKVIFNNNNSSILEYEFFFDQIIIRKSFNKDEFTKKRTDFEKYEILCWGKGYWKNLIDEPLRYPINRFRTTLFEHKYETPILEKYGISYSLPDAEILLPNEVYEDMGGPQFGLLFGKNNLSEAELKNKAREYCDWSNLKMLKIDSRDEAISQTKQKWTGNDLVSKVRLVYRKTTPPISYSEYPKE